MKQLALLGQTIERVLSNPDKKDATPPILGVDDFTGPSLLDKIQTFDPGEWTVDRLEGAIYRRNRALLVWHEPDSLPDHLEWQAVALCVMRTKEKRTPAPFVNSIRERPDDYVFSAQLSALIGEDLGELLLAFTGRQFTDDELADMERVE